MKKITQFHVLKTCSVTDVYDQNDLSKITFWIS